MSCNSFAGILFPKIKFRFGSLGNRPPASASERLNAGAEYLQVFTMEIRSAGNSFQYYFVPTIFVNKPYRVLHIKEMKYEWENNTGVFLKDRSFEIPVSDYLHNTQTGWYWLGGLGGRLPEVNLEKIFKGKKPDDTFLLKLTLVFSFDDESENTQVLEYNVTVEKGEYEYISF